MNPAKYETEDIIDFEEEISDTPTEPGIYIFWNKKTECLYIGKATNIRDRLRSHLMSYKECELLRRDVDYDDPEIEEYALKRFADQTIHLHMDKVSKVTTMTINPDGLRESAEEQLIRSLHPEYNEDYNHVEPDEELKLRCPECERQLHYMKTAGECGGYVCKNFDCRHYWKLNNGDVVEVMSE